MAAQYSYIGKGSIYIDGLPVGNVSALQFSIDEEKKELADYENAGGGTIDTVSRITGVSMSLSVTNLSPENLAIALRGEATATAAGSVSNESHANITLGKLILADRIPDPDQSLTATYGGTDAWAALTAYSLGDKIVDGTHIYEVTTAGTSGGSEPTWPTDGSTVNDGTVVWTDRGTVTLTENTDYTRVRAGIIPLATSVKIDTGDTVKLAYSALAENLVQALVESGREFDMVFDGLNEAKSGKSVIVHAFKVKFNPAQAVDFIGDEFAELEMTADVVKDTTKTGAGVSQYFTIRMTQVA